MVQSKCNGCNRVFTGTHGLSNHCQHNNECKSIHLELNNHQSNLSFGIHQVNGEKTKVYQTIGQINQLTEFNIDQIVTEDGHVAAISEHAPANLESNNLEDMQSNYAQCTKDHDIFVYT